MVTAMFKLKISELRCDNGGEFTSSDQKEYYKKKGIKLTTTIAYTPQQNGVAERLNWTLENMIRTMLIAAKLPESMWGEALLAATYLLNRSPTNAIQEKKTPAELWCGSKPDLKKLRVFGCQRFDWIPDQKRSKLKKKSQKALMMGYTPNGY